MTRLLSFPFYMIGGIIFGAVGGLLAAHRDWLKQTETR